MLAPRSVIAGSCPGVRSTACGRCSIIPRATPTGSATPATVRTSLRPDMCVGRQHDPVLQQPAVLMRPQRDTRQPIAEVRRPCRKKRVEPAHRPHRLGDGHQDVVPKQYGDAYTYSDKAASLSRAGTQRRCQEGKDRAGEGDGELAVVLDGKPGAAWPAAEQ